VIQPRKNMENGKMTLIERRGKAVRLLPTLGGGGGKFGREEGDDIQSLGGQNTWERQKVIETGRGGGGEVQKNSTFLKLCLQKKRKSCSQGCKNLSRKKGGGLLS